MMIHTFLKELRKLHEMGYEPVLGDAMLWIIPFDFLVHKAIWLKSPKDGTVLDPLQAVLEAKCHISPAERNVTPINRRETTDNARTHLRMSERLADKIQLAAYGKEGFSSMFLYRRMKRALSL